MDLSLPKINTEIPDFLLGDMWTLPEKFKNVFLCMWEAKPLGDCRSKTEWPYLIHEIWRVGRDVIFHYGYTRGQEYRLPEQYAKAVSNADIYAVNTYRNFYSVVKRERDDGSGIGDLVIEWFELSDVAGYAKRKTRVRCGRKGELGQRGTQSCVLFW